MSEDKLFNELFDNYVERTPRCKAIQVRYENAWKVSELLRRSGLGTKVISTGDVFTIEVLRGDETLFIADVIAGDAIVTHGDYLYNDGGLSLVPGSQFRRTWEKDTGG